MKGDTLRSQNHDELKSSMVDPSNKIFFKAFFRLTIFFQDLFFFQGTSFVQFFMYCKTKKIGVIVFHPVVVIGLGKNLLFKSVLAHCVLSLA